MTKTLSIIISLLLLSTSCGKRLTYLGSRSQEKCACKTDGYWYDNKCWKDFEDEAISINAIDSVVGAELEAAALARITVGNDSYPLNVFFPIPQKKTVILLTEYTDSNGRKSMISIVPQKAVGKDKVVSNVALFNGTIMNDNYDTIPYAAGKVQFLISEDQDEFAASGHFLKANQESDSLPFSYVGSESLAGLGDSKLEIIGDEAYLSGDLGTKTYKQIKDLIDNHPNVTTLVLTSISGSVNDLVNMHTGRLVHEAGLDTKVLSDSDIASGGVDLFCAGKNRIVEQGARIGIHSWCCVNDLTAIELPKNHPAHKYQINYFTLVMGAEKGVAFYFHTLEAAPFDGVHWMSDEDIQKWNVSTQFIKK